MSCRKLKKKSHGGLTKETHYPPFTLQTLISAIQSTEGLSQANMKILYAMLVSLSKSVMSGSKCESSLSSSDVELGKLKFKEISVLSDRLFEELDRRFKEFFSALHDVSATTTGIGQAALLTDIWAKTEELLLLLRCCMVLLILFDFVQELLLEKGRLLLSILGRLISIELSSDGKEKVSLTFKRLFSLECFYDYDDSNASVTEASFVPSYPCYALICRVLEVFADELLMHKSLRNYFVLIKSASCRSELLFNFHFGHGSIGSVLEVISTHFILSVSDERAFMNFINRLVWCHKEDCRIPEISLPAALSLLLNPAVLSAPKMFQAHLILLVSESIGIFIASENMMLDVQLMDWYSIAFERSIILYTRCMSSLQLDSHNLAGNGSFVQSCLLGSSLPTFEYYLELATMDKLHLLMAKSKKLWESNLSNMTLKTNCELVAASITYVKKNLCIFDESCRDEILFILNCIILGCSSDAMSDTLFYKKGETSAQDIYLLASILKLMSSSMLQSIWYLRHVGFSGCLTSFKDVSSSKEYDRIIGILGCFEQFSTHLPIQDFFCETMQSHHKRHKGSMWMLLHLLGLLSLSFHSGIDFLVKGCLFTTMTLLNLFILEEGDLSVLGSFFCSGTKSFSSKSSDNVERVLVVRKSTQLISLEIQKTQDLHLRTSPLLLSDKSQEDMQVDNTEETCNGEIFLKCVLGRKSSISDFDDLADFIACKPGKDYSGWVRNRQRFRQWRHKKTTTLRWKRRKMAWNSMKGR